jgi:hypothetical protein
MMPHKSKSEYPANWGEIALQVKKEAGWKCVRCGYPNDQESGHVLTVHHLDMDPQNCEWWNLVALCQKCHLHIQAKVVMQRLYLFDHSAWFKPYVAGYYAHYYGHPTDKEYVMANLETLLDYGRPNGRLINTLIIVVPADEPISTTHIRVTGQPGPSR